MKTDTTADRFRSDGLTSGSPISEEQPTMSTQMVALLASYLLDRGAERVRGTKRGRLY